MKLKFLIFETKASAWVEAARTEYGAKLKGFLPFEIQTLKSPSAERDQADVKKRREAELLIKQIDDRDLVVLFDETGKTFRGSEEFSAQLRRLLESGKQRIVFCIGGPYGFDETVRARAGAVWSLSGLTMNHWVAQITALEQVYRAFTILRGIPYHNK
jgi:23S rRNA (pseudouridine1915-N3)-methyltransferase